MSINGVNKGQPAFTARTQEGNHYDKTNAGKLTGTVLAAGMIGAKVHTQYKADKDLFKKFIDISAIKNAGNAKAKFSKLLNHCGLKIVNPVKPVKLGAVGIALTFPVILGAIVDGMTNHRNAKRADRAAE